MLVFAFLLMLLSFRSLTIAVTSIVLNLLSVGAAYGVLVAVFQHGWGASLVGAEGVGAIVAWLPLFLFVILFGLSMDYHVFVVSRIREARLRGRRPRTRSSTASAPPRASSPAPRPSWSRCSPSSARCRCRT